MFRSQSSDQKQNPRNYYQEIFADTTVIQNFFNSNVLALLKEGDYSFHAISYAADFIREIVNQSEDSEIFSEQNILSVEFLEIPATVNAGNKRYQLNIITHTEEDKKNKKHLESILNIEALTDALAGKDQSLREDALFLKQVYMESLLVLNKTNQISCPRELDSQMEVTLKNTLEILKHQQAKTHLTVQEKKFLDAASVVEASLFTDTNLVKPFFVEAELKALTYSIAFNSDKKINHLSTIKFALQLILKFFNESVGGEWNNALLNIEKNALKNRLSSLSAQIPKLLNHEVLIAQITPNENSPVQHNLKITANEICKALDNIENLIYPGLNQCKTIGLHAVVTKSSINMDQFFDYMFVGTTHVKNLMQKVNLNSLNLKAKNLSYTEAADELRLIEYCMLFMRKFLDDHTNGLIESTFLLSNKVIQENLPPITSDQSNTIPQVKYKIIGGKSQICIMNPKKDRDKISQIFSCLNRFSLANEMKQANSEEEKNQLRHFTLLYLEAAQVQINIREFIVMLGRKLFPNTYTKAAYFAGEFKRVAAGIDDYIESKLAATKIDLSNIFEAPFQGSTLLKPYINPETLARLPADEDLIESKIIRLKNLATTLFLIRRLIAGVSDGFIEKNVLKPDEPINKNLLVNMLPESHRDRVNYNLNMALHNNSISFFVSLIITGNSDVDLEIKQIINAFLNHDYLLSAFNKSIAGVIKQKQRTFVTTLFIETELVLSNIELIIQNIHLPLNEIKLLPLDFVSSNMDKVIFQEIKNRTLFKGEKFKERKVDNKIGDLQEAPPAPSIALVSPALPATLTSVKTKSKQSITTLKEKSSPLEINRITIKSSFEVLEKFIRQYENLNKNFRSATDNTIFKTDFSEEHDLFTEQRKLREIKNEIVTHIAPIANLIYNSLPDDNDSNTSDLDAKVELLGDLKKQLKEADTGGSRSKAKDIQTLMGVLNNELEDINKELARLNKQRQMELQKEAKKLEEIRLTNKIIPKVTSKPKSTAAVSNHKLASKPTLFLTPRLQIVEPPAKQRTLYPAQYLIEVVNALTSIRKILVLNENELNDEHRHYALLYHIVRCIELLKSYLPFNRGTDKLDKKQIRDFRNDLIHHGAGAGEEKEVQRFAEHLIEFLPKVLIVITKPYSTLPELPPQHINLLLNEFKIDKTEFKFDKYGNLDNMLSHSLVKLDFKEEPLFDHLIKFHNAKTDNEWKKEHYVQVLKRYLPLIRLLIEMIRPLVSNLTSSHELSDQLLFKIQALRMLAAISGEFKFNFKVEKMTLKFLEYCFQHVKKAVGHDLVDMPDPLSFINEIEQRLPPETGEIAVTNSPPRAGFFTQSRSQLPGKNLEAKSAPSEIKSVKKS